MTLSPLTPADHTRMVTATLTFTVDDTVTDDQIDDLIGRAMIQIEEPTVTTPDGLDDEYLGKSVQAQHATHTIAPL